MESIDSLCCRESGTEQVGSLSAFGTEHGSPVYTPHLLSGRPFLSSLPVVFESLCYCMTLSPHTVRVVHAPALVQSSPILDAQ